MPKLRSSSVPTALSSGCQKLGQPVPLSNLVSDENRSRSQPAQWKTPLRCSLSSSLVQGRSDIFPAASRELFGRAMMYLDATPNATVHWTILQGEGRAADGTHDAYYRYGGQQQNGAGLMANYETNMGVSTDCYSHSAMRMPTRAWTCVEWHFKVATNEEQLWLNGNEVGDLHVVDRPTTAGSGCLGNGVNGEWLAPPQFTTLHLGWEQYQQTNNATNLWVDDVAISSTQRLGCPAQ